LILNLELVYEAISGIAIIAGGTFLAVGLLIRHRWLGEHNGIERAVGIAFGVFLVVYGVYVVNLSRQGYMVVKGFGVVRSR